MARLTKKKYAIIAGVSAVALTGGAAFAYWTSIGSGDGSATAGTDGGFKVVVEDSSAVALTPGGPTDNISYTVQNLSSGHQKLEAAPTVTVTTNKPGCDTTDFAITGLTYPNADLSPNATAGDTGQGSFDVQMVNKATNQDACKSATVKFHVAIP